ncbi:flap endonuclease-1 [Caldivirga maquilingensis]|uniref:Flap endonuclease 1 n=1 Tax=Caldivirga maquilingensis (strain ATCC 700844 / DSM 13496 / JCM 10307 / IC-167) TaxID=397948 RepID=FEN_CALMQ|nr:flap endonuclease-1 [Caldivirga maquilingensis]A8M9L3.1 RecName: Full=Flap endonuclease 1; Short=FEN-1; AltName: Full=Flap structure-specific endonuclease 1 [Caldivirga maquilingensis IC-167]ABW00894.1 XPG I [Caldivirga maquilingensis IC-167]
MGVTELGKLIPDNLRRRVSLEQLNGKLIALDAYNALYQFLASIRQPDGTPLMDSQGRVTSHLSGLLYRTINLLEYGIKPVYVFDGKPPELKLIEIEKRRRVREKAVEDWIKAVEEGKKSEARKYAQRALFITSDMVDEAKRLLDSMGVPWVQAPSEGEAQAAYMASKGIVWAAGSQDYDSFLFGAPRLVRNLTISGRRKLPGRDEYVEVTPELIELNDVLKALRLRDRGQLIDLAILLGTDYNPEGIPGIGPQRALRLIQEYGSLDKLMNTVLKNAQFPVDPFKIREFFLNPPVTQEVNVKFKEPNEDEVVRLLVEEHDFSQDRVKNALERLRKSMGKAKGSTTLDSFFG